MLKASLAGSPQLHGVSMVVEHTILGWTRGRQEAAFGQREGASDLSEEVHVPAS